MDKSKYQIWMKDMVRNQKAQEIIEQKLDVLINTFFGDNDEYAVEKFIKSFGEPIKYLEEILEKNRDIHPNQLKDNLIYLSQHNDEYFKKVEVVEKVLISEIERQSRHFRAFLSAVKR